MKKVTKRVSAKGGQGGIMGTSATVEVKLKDGRLHHQYAVLSLGKREKIR
jgi:hypothetical protein